MKSKAAFIVKYADQSSALGESVKLVTEAILAKDIRSQYDELFPNAKVKVKHIDDLTHDAIARLNGASMTEQDYHNHVHDFAIIVNQYENTSILDFGNLLRIVQMYETQARDAQLASQQEQGPVDQAQGE